MYKQYKNSKGYSDPTAGAALSHVIGEQRREAKKKARRRPRAEDYKNAPRVYVVSPFAGDIRRNTDKAMRYCRYVMDKGGVPVAAHLIYPRFLNDKKPYERRLGLVFGLSLLSACDEVWVFGENVSEGMRQEIVEAHRLGKPLRYIEEDDVI